MVQASLFPWLSEELGPLTEKQQELVTILELIRIEEFIVSSRGYPGRPPQDRTAIARAFVAKMVYKIPTTRALLDRLKTDSSLRRICGWERKNDVSDEWTFSRAFAEFSDSCLPERVHEAFIKKSYKGEIVGHNSRDSTAIEAREKPLKKESVKKVAIKRGRPKKGEERVKPLTRIEKQANGMSLNEMLDDLPKACDVGTKKNSKGYKVSWIGYKLHPLKNEMTAENKRCRLVGHKTAEVIRYNERSTAERVNARLKDEFGGRVVRVRGHAKVMCHLMFGILALTANQMLILVT